MKHLKTLLLICFLASAFGINAQNITITRGGKAGVDLVKGATPINFIVNGDHYFINKFYEHSVMNYHLQTFDEKGSYIAKGNIEVPIGTFNNTYSIDDILPVGNKVYAMVEHLEKATGKNTLLARTVDNHGKVADAEVEVMNIPFEKIMNSGYNYSAASADGKTVAVVGEMPFVKEQPAQFKVALFDQDMKKTKEGTINFPGENTKNKSISIAVANDGTVYIIKKGMTKKGEMTLAVYQWSAATPADVKEYVIELTPPNQILSYSYVVNSSNELVLAGLYYERKTMTVGETKTVGALYYTNKNKTENVFKTFALDAPVDNLTARKILLNGNTIFLTAEQYKENRIAPPANTSAMNFDYNYDYIHKSEFVIAMDTDGNKKFQLELQKDAVARDFDQQFYSAYYICNGKLTVVYNDQASKYIKNYSSYNYQQQIPVLVQITNDGLMQPPVIFKDKLRLDDYYMVYPAFSVQDAANQLSFISSNNEYFEFISVKVE